MLAKCDATDDFASLRSEMGECSRSPQVMKKDRRFNQTYLPLYPSNDSYFGLGGDLRLNFPIDDGWTFQLDLAGESGFVDNSNDNYTGSVLGGGHVSWRDPSEWLLGGFVGIGNGFNADDDTVTTWLIGAEGQFYLTDWTFYGQLAYLDAYDVTVGADDAFRDAWIGRGVVRYFLGADGKLEGELSYANGVNDTDSAVL
jgi:hypothetical protein